MNAKSLFSLFKETFQEWSADKASRLAAALAYYTVFSIPPLLLIILGLVGLVLDEQVVRTRIIEQMNGLIGEQGAEAIDMMLQNAAGPEGGLLATVVGVVTLLVGATGVFAQLQDAMDTIWEVEHVKQGFLQTIKDRFLSFTMVVGVAFLLLVSLLFSTVLTAVNEFVAGLIPAAILAQVVNTVFSLAVTILLFAVIFKVLPEVHIQWRDVWVGAIVTGILFTIGRFAIGTYLGASDMASTYGAAGSLVILLFWVYYSANILFLGAEFTQVYANNYGSQIVPKEGAVPVTEEKRAEQGIPHQGPGNQQIATPPQQPARFRSPSSTVQAIADRQPQEEDNMAVYYITAVLALLIGFGRWLRR